ncbi:acyltransferase family protein [Burkholderia stagnalis]|uniref:acyltransferase family protein n=1 Tax=Burkholderia stagnalis TaxID=1503054 RepID=UPI0009C12E3A|nr:acyltransferase family protein [Burkholderia stagnalis]
MLYPTAKVSTNNSLNYRPDIDGLRAIAVIAVVAFHAFPNYLKGGFVGVDIFFVISGYLITKFMLVECGGGDFSLAQFYVRRVKRLFPALLILLASCYAFGWFNLFDTEFKSLGKHIAAGALSVVNIVLWTEAGYFDAAADYKPLLHLWSLGVEEQFYLLWPIVLLAVLRLKRNPVIAISVIAMASFVTNIVLVKSHPVAAFFLPMSRAWELMFGALLAWRHVTTVSLESNRGIYKSALGLILIVVALVSLDRSAVFPGWWALVPVVGTCLLLDAGASSWLNRRLLAHPALVAIGLISYPLYLYHWPLLSFLRIMDIDAPSWWMRTAAVLVSVLMAWLTYRFVERPIRREGKAITKVSWLVVLVAVMGYVGYNTYDRNGLSFRMNHVVTDFTGGMDFDLDKEWRRGACFLTDGKTEFAQECMPAGSGPLVFLWGDSDSAAVYPAMRDAAPRYGVRLAQYSKSTCPPVFNQRCPDVEENIRKIVERNRPDVIVLAAYWWPKDITSLGPTVEMARNAGVRRIVLLGPAPKWTAPLPELYWKYWRAKREILPARTTFGLNPDVAEVDRSGRQQANALGIEYVSAYQLMCNDQGCLTRVGPGKGRISMVDTNHLTPDGARALLDMIGPSLFKIEAK